MDHNPNRPQAEINHPDPWNPNVLDSAIAAAAAAEALAAGRVELGYEMSRVALRAHLWELRRPLPPASTPVYAAAAAESPFFATPDTSQPIHPYERPPALVDTAVFTPNCNLCGEHPADVDCPMKSAISARCIGPDVTPGHYCHGAIWFHPQDGKWRHVDTRITGHDAEAPLEVHEAAIQDAQHRAAGA